MGVMTYREYQRCTGYYASDGKNKEKPKPKKSDKPVEFGPPIIEPLTETQKAKLLWAGRLKIKEPVT